MSQKPQQIIHTLNRRQSRQKREKISAVIAALLLIGAWFYGYFQASASVEANFALVFPQADRFVRSGSVWEAYAGDFDQEPGLIGYVGIGRAPSYGGPLEVIVGVDLEGTVNGAMVVDHRDTPSFFHNVTAGGFLNQIPGKTYLDPFQVDDDIDAVTGATITSAAISHAVKEVAVRVANTELSKSVQLPQPPLKIGIPEITLVLLYATSFIAYRPQVPGKKIIRWAGMITGMVVLGFWFNRPLTVAHFTSLLSGYLPNWRENIYWFLLLGGIIIGVTVENRNPYCSWFCPFGAFQECLSAVGNTRWQPPRIWQSRLKWAVRFLAFSALFFGLALRQPGATSYEIFGTLFALNGSVFQWILLVLVILSSLVIYRPWCKYLCPLDPIVDFVFAVRRWLKALWMSKVVKS